MNRYRVALLGCGPRGVIHANAFKANDDRFDLVALCDLDEAKLAKVAGEVGVEKTFTDAEAMMADVKPDVFCFATLPDVRLPMIELGVRHGVKAIAYEKPVATTLAEARRVRDLCREAGVKTIVSHQIKYGPHFQKVREIVDRWEIGPVHTIHATSKAWLLQLGTHMIDYAMWLNGGYRGIRVSGHVHGRGRLGDTHPSPEYALGQIEFANGSRLLLECGEEAPDTPETDMFWHKDAVNLYGQNGWARVLVGGGWSAMTKETGGQVISGPGVTSPPRDQVPYLRELADWLDDESSVHCCNGEVAYHGFELAMAVCLSALERRPIDIPIETLPEPTIFERLEKELPDVPRESMSGPPAKKK